MYKNVEIDLKPQPVLEELIEDLTNKMLSFKELLHMEQDHQYCDPTLCKEIEDKIKFLDAVIERCYAQQELVYLKNEQIIGLN